MKKLLSSFLLVILLVSVFASAALAELPDYVYTHGSVNMRSSASLNGKIVKVLETGTECEVLSSKKDSRDVLWYKVDVNGKTGWVSSVYTNDSEDEGTVKGYLKSTGNVNLRAAANGKPILAVIKKGSTVAYFKSKTVGGLKWLLVRYNGTIGWAAAKYFSENGKETSPDATAVTATGDVNIRKDASIGAKILGVLRKGKTATYLGSKKSSGGVTWYKVKYNGITGYVCSAYAKKK